MSQRWERRCAAIVLVAISACRIGFDALASDADGSLGGEAVCSGFDSAVLDATIVSGGRVRLSPGVATGSVSGTCDGGRSTRWTSLTPRPAAAYGKPLVAESESGYPDVAFDATAVIGHWPLDGQGSLVAGDGVADASGTGTHATTVNPDGVGMVYVPGKIGSGLQFDGTDGYLTATLPSIAGTYTLLAWISLDEISTENHILAPGTIQFFVDDGGTLEAGDGAEYNIQGATLFEIGRWYHAAFVQRASDWSLYLDGREDATGPQVATPGTNLLIGQIFSLFSGAYIMNGRIDEAAVISRPLSPTEIRQVYERGALRVRYEARTCDELPCGGAFVGPFSETSSTSTTPAVYDLSALPAGRYLQWRATLESDDLTTSPELVDMLVAGDREN